MKALFTLAVLIGGKCATNGTFVEWIFIILIILYLVFSLRNIKFVPNEKYK